MEAVNAFVDELAEKKCVGLFYYAGHGIQLGWKNYLLPVDIQVGAIRDVPTQSVEVNALMQGLGKAGNALNVVILDACRDNPFGSLEGLDQKGLSQMDAPNQTLLAYATAPGNVAEDGDEATGNGLFTHFLLKELQRPAKIEDVFKRVRLQVRQKSQGRQIPWDSSSLEDDFAFNAQLYTFLSDAGLTAPRLAQATPVDGGLLMVIAFENLSGQRDLPDGKKENANLALYSKAMASVAQKRGLTFVDLFTATQGRLKKKALPAQPSWRGVRPRSRVSSGAITPFDTR